MKKIRMITSTSLFDGHDASINIMRRILQSSGVEVIHLGHNRSVDEIVNAAIQEDVNAIAITSYQGGHIEFFKYMIDKLKQNESEDIKVFGGGGGTILPSEILELESYGVSKIYSPDDGRKMGLQGMIDHLLSEIKKADLSQNEILNFPKKIAKAFSAMNLSEKNKIDFTHEKIKTGISLGITGTGGAGKSSITDELLRRFKNHFDSINFCIIAVDPSKKKTGGALLGDRIRMNSIDDPRVFMRSVSTNETSLSIHENLGEMVLFCKKYFDIVFVETAGIGQSDSEITNLVDIPIYAMTPEFGANTQLEKIEMLEYADLVLINKSDRFGALDAKKSVSKQYQRNHKLFDSSLDSLPVYSTMASNIYDTGMNQVFQKLVNLLDTKFKIKFESKKEFINLSSTIEILPISRENYLSEISNLIRENNNYNKLQIEYASNVYKLEGAIKLLENEIPNYLVEKKDFFYSKLDIQSKSILNNWESKIKSYSSEEYIFKVREKEIKIKNFSTSLSNLSIPKIATPKFSDYGDRLNWAFNENYPGEFPYTSGVYPFKRSEEDPGRMFAGEGNPERTNRRFHYITKGQKAKRLSTAFDSVTLYGENPDSRMDIFGKIGNSGVSIASLDDMKKLYSGFDLIDEFTSVSMTINGPAPMILAFFLNAAIDQECEKFIISSSKKEIYLDKIIQIKFNHLLNKEVTTEENNQTIIGKIVSMRFDNLQIKFLVEFQNGNRHELDQRSLKLINENELNFPKYETELPDGNLGLGLLLLGLTGDEILEQEIYENIKDSTLKKVRGTVQADILKEDQAQNTCIFSIDFSLKLMGDIAEYFVKNKIQNFYSVSISGYHIAEAGANPITQLAFTLANGFTYIEYYLSRGLEIDEFAPNLSFFFSNGLDPEYSVLGRVARRIWAKTLKLKYKASPRSQMLKYHIQTSGRSLHAQEIEFNDIRTSLQALTALNDNCNSLHTNAFDEAITTPTEDSVRRAMAIQMIINKENGLSQNQNSLQGSFIIEELTNLVEEAVLLEFENISRRKGVLGAMETMYQRNKIQEESLHYETLKHSGEISIIGVNTFLSSKGSPTLIPNEVIRSSDEEKNLQIQNVNLFHLIHKNDSENSKEILKNSVLKNENVFETLMNTSKKLSLGQMTKSLFEVGGKYRRNI